MRLPESMTFAEFDRVHRRSLRTVNEVLGTRLFHREIPAREPQWDTSNYGNRSSTLPPRISNSRFDTGRDFQSKPQTMNYSNYQRQFDGSSRNKYRDDSPSNIYSGRLGSVAPLPTPGSRSIYQSRPPVHIPSTPKPARAHDRKRDDLDFLNRFNAPLRQEPVKGPRVKRFPTGLDFDSGILIKPSYGSLTTELRREISEEKPYHTKSTLELNMNRLERIKKMATPHMKRKPVKIHTLKSDSDTSMDVSFSMPKTKPLTPYKNKNKNNNKVDETAKALAKDLSSLVYVFDSYKVNTAGHAKFLEEKLKEVQKKAVLSKICQNDFPHFLQCLLRLRSRIQTNLTGLDDQRTRMIIKDQLEDCSEQLLRIVV